METTAVAPRTDARGLLTAAGFAVALTFVGWLRHQNGWSGGLDLGIFDQGVWLLSEGMDPQVTINGRSMFADHLSPILLAFVPFYVLAATPFWLIAGQAASLGAGVLAIRRLAREAGVDTGVVTLAYCLSAAVLAAAIFDFHPSTVAVLPLSWLVWSVHHPDRRPVVVAALAVLVCRADLGWVVAATAIAAPRRHRPALVAIGIAGVVAGSVVPATFGGEGTFEVHYGHLGDSPGDVLLHPWRVLGAFATKDLIILFLWGLAGGLLPLLAPRWALAVLVAGLPVLASRWPGTEDPFTHYGATVAPLVLAGAIAGLARRHRWSQPRVLVVGAITATLLAGPFAPRAPEPYSVATVVEENFDGRLDDALAAVRPGEPVSAVNRVVPHISHRERVYGFPIPFVTSDLAVLYGESDPDIAAQIQTVIGRPDDREQMERFGFIIEDLGALLIGRRPPDDER